MKLFTRIDVAPLPRRIRLEDRIMSLGSCFADNMAAKLTAAGFDVCSNPFGTLYNPFSVLSSLERIASCTPFTPEDCVEMGAGANMVCSFHHHSSFARAGKDEFLSDANTSLKAAAEFWKSCNVLIITFGTAMVWKRADSGMIVSNCLKRPASEFIHEMTDIPQIEEAIKQIRNIAGDRLIIFSASPVRHLGEGAHINTLSKARLQLALEKECTGNTYSHYFPSYEILLDELRDYRFYAEDLCHPNSTAIDCIWERFCECCTEPSEAEAMRNNEKAFRRSQHRPLLHNS